MNKTQTAWLAKHGITYTRAHGCEFFERGQFYVEVSPRGAITVNMDPCDPMVISAHTTLRDALKKLIACM